MDGFYLSLGAIAKVAKRSYSLLMDSTEGEPIQKVGGDTVVQIKIDTAGLRHAVDTLDEVVLQKTMGRCRYYFIPNVAYRDGWALSVYTGWQAMQS